MQKPGRDASGSSNFLLYATRHVPCRGPPVIARSEATKQSSQSSSGLLRFARNDGGLTSLTRRQMSESRYFGRRSSPAFLLVNCSVYDFARSIDGLTTPARTILS